MRMFHRNNGNGSICRYRSVAVESTYNDGRRCGKCCGAEKLHSATRGESSMCNGSSADGFGLLVSSIVSERQLQIRCAADAACVGYYSYSLPGECGERGFRPLSAIQQGRRLKPKNWTLNVLICTSSVVGDDHGDFNESLANDIVVNVTACTVCRAAGGPIRYLHIPKSGSVLAPWVWAFGCPNLPTEQLVLRKKNHHSSVTAVRSQLYDYSCPCLLGGAASAEAEFRHRALPENRSSPGVRGAVALFRSPLARAISAYDYDMHAHEIYPAVRHDMTRLVSDAGKACSGCNRTEKRMAQLLTFANVSFVKHVATKMLLGKHPSAIFHPTASHIAEAVGRVALLRFVGLLECWNETTRLFERALFQRPQTAPSGGGSGGLSGMHSEDHELDRLTRHPPHQWFRTSNTQQWERRMERDAMLASGYTDEADEAVYRAAVSRFGAELRALNISAESEECARTLQDAGVSGDWLGVWPREEV